MSSIPRNSLETLLISVFSRFVALAGSVVMARVLGPAGKGVLTYAVSILSFALAPMGGQTATGLNPLELVAFNREDLLRYLELLDGARRTVSAAGAR
jgi:hypothetical protein